MFRRLLTQTPAEFFEVMHRLEEIARHWYD
jgi:hypothetical protein